jgi:hypothetical protein
MARQLSPVQQRPRRASMVLRDRNRKATVLRKRRQRR